MHLFLDPANLVITSSDDPGLRITEHSPAQLRASSIVVRHGQGGDAEYYRHGFTSWSPTSWWRLSAPPWRVWDNPDRLHTAEDSATDRDDLHQSYTVTTVALAHDNVLLVGAVGPRTGRIVVGPEDLSASALDDDGSELEWFVAVGPEAECWGRYVDAWRGVVGAHPTAQPGAVWSSWYSWFEEITQEIILDEARQAADIGYHICQVDDGWEQQIGHWQPNAKFPAGMEALAGHIEGLGLRPGLWLAPFIAVEQAPVVRAHPEYFVHDEDGAPLPAGFNWGGNYYALDCTHPGALEWVVDVVREARGWGFTYFKLDFLNAAAIVGRRHRDVPREVAYREGLKALRDALPDAYLMGSGAVVGSSLGLLDGVRVGPDTAPYWDNTERRRDPSGPGLRNALRNSIARLWLGGLVHIDPDVAFARSRGSLLSPEANAISQDAARVCGTFGCSDPHDWLSDDERARLRALCREFAPGRTPTVERLGRHRFRVDGREVDFEPWISPAGRMSDRLLAK